MSLENLSVWTVDPDWANGLIERLEWQTTILTSPLNVEQRFATRLSPRQIFDIDFTVYGPKRTYLDLLILRLGGSPFYMPLWHEAERLQGASSIGDTTISIDSTHTEFRTCKAVLLFKDCFNYELAEVQSLDSDGNPVFPVGLTKTWSIGTRVYPVKKFRVLDAPEASRKTAKVITTTVRFESLEPNPSLENILLPVFDSHYVWEGSPNDVDNLSYTYTRNIVVLDNTTGIQDLYDVTATPTQQFAWYAKGRPAHAELRAFLYRLKGRCIPVWMPTFFADLELADDVSEGDTALQVKRCGFADLNGPWSNRTYLQIALRDGTFFYTVIVGATLSGDGVTESIALWDSVPSAILRSNVKRISFMNLCRQDQDSIEIKHYTNTKGLTTATSVFVSLLSDVTTGAISDSWVTPPTSSGEGGDGYDSPEYYYIVVVQTPNHPTLINSIRDRSFNSTGPFYDPYTGAMSGSSYSDWVEKNDNYLADCVAAVEAAGGYEVVSSQHDAWSDVSTYAYGDPLPIFHYAELPYDGVLSDVTAPGVPDEFGHPFKFPVIGPYTSTPPSDSLRFVTWGSDDLGAYPDIWYMIIRTSKVPSRT